MMTRRFNTGCSLREIVNMRRFRMLAALLALLASGTAAAQAGRVTVFTQLSTPAGIATDIAGNVFVSSDTFVSTMLRAYDPGGNLLAQVPFENTLSTGTASHLAIESNSSRIANLQADGTVILVDGSSGQVTPVVSLRELPTDVSQIFDVQTNSFRNATGVLQPEFAQYGDIAVLTRGGTIDVFASGYLAGLAFVTRVRFAPGAEPSARVVVSSSGPLLGGSAINIPRGVAVNHLGIVATSLPVLAQLGNTVAMADRAVAFSADFPEGVGFQPSIALGGIDLPSRGMATDLQGNFYVSTGPFTSSICGAGARGLVRVLAATGGADCFTIAGANVDANDVAVSPEGDAAYVVMRSDGAVLRVQLR
jgi:hypothetical protein